MIRSFKDKDTEKLFMDLLVLKFKNIERIARRKLMFLNQAHTLGDLKSPPSNHLELLKGNRKGQHSIRINKQWRLCFRWENNEVYDVEIVDYH
jgi:proteic killer suppression protein